MSLSEEQPGSKDELKNTIPLLNVSGVYCLKSRFKEENVLDTIEFNPSPGDIFLVTYPKSGTTWVQYIIWNILNKSEPFPKLMDMMTKFIPYLEVSGTKVAEELPSPRIMKTHLDFEHNPYHPEAKYIYVARNAKDVCVSYYHFIHQLEPNFKDGTVDDFFELYLQGKVGYGSWYEHVYSWYVHKNDPNVLILTYEWMKENHAEAVIKIANFLGKQYKDELDQDPSLLKKIVENTTFKSMKNISVVVNDRPVHSNTEEKEDSSITTDKKESKKINVQADKTGDEDTSSKIENEEPRNDIVFFRKGKVGDWKAYLSKSQERRLNEKLLSRSKIASVMTLWENLWTIDDLLSNC